MRNVTVLRPYQSHAVDWVLRIATLKPNARLLIVLPMGGGKTAIAAALMALLVHHQTNVWGMYIAHRAELLEQAVRAMRDAGIPEDMIVGPKDQLGSACIMATTANVIHDIEDGKLQPIDLLITDEAHRDAGNYRRKLRNMFPDVLRIGFTATPERLDGRVLGEDYDDMLVAAQPSELIADGHLLAPRVFTVPPDRLPDLHGVTIDGGEFNSKELARRMQRFALMGDIVEHWKARAEERPTLAFACSTAHSKAIVERFNNAGIRASHIDGRTPPQQRADILDALREDRVDVVSSCDLLGEGIDIKEVKCIIMARPTASLVVSNQQGGRCMRPIPGTDATALILDHAGNIIRHGYPFADREWTLQNVRTRGGKRGNRSPTAKLIACQECHEVVAAKERCDACGATLVAKSKVKYDNNAVPIELPGDLIDVASAIPIAKRMTEYRRLAVFANTRGFEEDWVERVYRAKFNESHPT